MYHGNSQQSTVADSIESMVDCLAVFILQSVSYNGGQLERTYRGTVVGTIGADSLRPDLAPC